MAKINLGFNSFFFFLVGPLIGLNPLTGSARPVGSSRGRSGLGEKNPLSKRAWSGPLILTRGLGPDMKKPGLNLTRCHS